MYKNTAIDALFAELIVRLCVVPPMTVDYVVVVDGDFNVVIVIQQL